MKCSDLAKMVEQMRRLLEATSANTRPVETLRDVVSVAPEMTVLQFCKKISGLDISQSESSSFQLREAADFAEHLVAALSNIGKAGLLKDLDQLSITLRKKSHVDKDDLIDAFKAAAIKKTASKKKVANEAVVQKYLSALETALGDDVGFNQVFRTLEQDPMVKSSEAISLAKQFAFATVKSRAAALKKISSRHQALMTSRAKSSATAGRIAG